jgi:ribosomal-protein-alanine N-acetyltransferase
MTQFAALTVERLMQPDAEDFDAIVALEGESFSNPWTAAAFAEMLTSPVTRLYVARQPDRRVIGFCACWLIEDELHINTVAVKPAVRRQGVATRLLKEILAATGAQKATLEVRRSNVAALKLYESLGFASTAVRPRYYSSPEEDALVLWRHP